MGERFITPVRSSRVRWLGVAGAIGAVTVLLAPVAASAASVSDSASETHTLQALTGGSVDQFDASLGTLTQVDWTADVSVTTELCAENLSTAAGATPSGSTAASLSVSFPDGSVTTASVSDSVPAVSLSVSNGSNDCLGALVLGNDAAGQPPTFPSGASASDVYFNADTSTQAGGGSITDPAALPLSSARGPCPTPSRSRAPATSCSRVNGTSRSSPTVR